jgi:alcohol dehydrogenase class IV
VDDPLIVSDASVEAAGVLDRVLDPLDREPVRYEATTEPATDDFGDLPAASVDGVVAVGGGSCLDTAKVAAAILAHDIDPAACLGVDAVPGPVAPLVAVPTTSGTGSQATQTAVLSHDGVKRGISDEHLRPDVALVDPTLTFDLPRPVTARPGFDALVHALEPLTARDYRWVPDRPITYQGANPVSRSLSWRALRLVLVEHSARATFDGADRAARRELSLGSHLAGLAFSNAGLGAVHALASTVGGMTDRPHGECLAVSLRPGLAYNLPVRRGAYADLARALGFAEVEGATSDEGAAWALVNELEALAVRLGLPDSFGAVGLDPADLDAMVENTLVQERRLTTNPRTVTEEIREPLVAAL